MGLATADALAREGANVSMFARRRGVLDREAERLGALAVRGDVTNPADLKRLGDRTGAALGGIDILLKNSGGAPPGPPRGATPPHPPGPRPDSACSRPLPCPAF